MYANAIRARYVGDTVGTASPGRLLVMLYDKLVLDLTQAEDALRTGDWASADARLRHAQDIVIELHASLDPTKWSGAGTLASVYAFLLPELVYANVRRDPDQVARCRALVVPLRDAWSAAAEQLGA